MIYLQGILPVVDENNDDWVTKVKRNIAPQKKYLILIWKIYIFPLKSA
jgi:hypothetical protein